MTEYLLPPRQRDDGSILTLFGLNLMRMRCYPLNIGGII